MINGQPIMLYYNVIDSPLPKIYIQLSIIYNKMGGTWRH